MVSSLREQAAQLYDDESGGDDDDGRGGGRERENLQCRRGNAMRPGCQWTCYG